MKSIVHDMVKETVHSENTNIRSTHKFCVVPAELKSEYNKFELLENTLKIFGFSGLDDYETMISMKDVKRMNENDNLFLDKINEIMMDSFNKIEEVFPDIRNKLTALCIPFEMVHKNTGNYLKLVPSKFSLNEYLSVKKTKFTQNKTDHKYTIYDNYDDFEKYYKDKIHRSIGDGNILCDLASTHMNSSIAGIIKKKYIKEQHYFIYESDDEYFLRYGILKSVDIVKNIYTN